MIEEMLEIARRVNTLTDVQRIKWTPTLLPPEQDKGKPIILLRLSDAWRDYFVVHAEARERIEAETVRNFIKEMPLMVEELSVVCGVFKNRPANEWNFEEVVKVSETLDAIVKIGLPAPAHSEVDLFLKDSFWHDLVTEINFKTSPEIYPAIESCLQNLRGEIGMFADENGWCVALTTDWTSSQMRKFSKKKIECRWSNDKNIKTV